MTLLDSRLKKQIDFLIEIDKVKNIFRMTYVSDKSRKENDAEHSWHLGIMAFLLSEYIKEEIDIKKVIKMVLIHDLVEIYAGDTFAFDEKGHEDKYDREKASADKIFGMLPKDQKQEFYELWEEFEECKTIEAKYGAMLDRLQPLLLNYATEGGSWKDHNITVEQVYKRNEIVLNEGPKEFRDLVNYVVDECIKKGYISGMKAN
ncbi:MAG: HD domain-containing protein [Peptostreptococcaceae bacterium]